MRIKSSNWRVVFSAMAFCVFIARLSFADVITFTMTNIVTGLPDTNAIILNPLLPEVGASGQYYTAGLPVLLNPNASGFVQTTQYAGFWNANNQFISRNWTGAGSPGSFSGVSFVVLSNGTSSTYPFTQYPLSGSSGGANVFNLYSGILAVNGINGIAASTIAGVVTIDGAGFTVTITYAALTNGLGYIPANTNFVITEIVNTNNLGATGGNRYYNNTNYDAFGIGILSFQSASNMTLTVLGASNTIYEAQITSTSNGVTTAFQNALGASNIIYQAQITGTSNGCVTTASAALNATNATIQLQIAATTNGLNTLILNSTNASAIANVLNTNRFLQAATTINDGSSISNLVTAPSSGLTNFVAELANGKLTPFPLTSLPSGGTGGGVTSVVETNAGPSAIGGSILYSRTNFDQPPGIALTVGQANTNNALSISNNLQTQIINSNTVYQAQILNTSNAIHSVDSTTSNLLQQAIISSNTVYQSQITGTSNGLNSLIGSSWVGTSNQLNTLASGITNNNLYINGMTNGQGIVNLGNLNMADWRVFTNASGLIISNITTAQYFFILSIASGNNALWGSTNNSLVTSNGLFLGTLTESQGASLPGQVFISNLTNAAGASIYIIGNTWNMVGGGLNIGTMPFTANLSTSTNLGGTGATITGMFSGGGNGGANALTNLIFALASTNNNIGFVMTNGIASNTLAIVTNIIQSTNNAIYTAIGASNAIYEPQITATSNGVTALTYPLANTNSPTIWNETLHSNLFFGGHPYQWEGLSSLGVTNFSGNLAIANGTYMQASSTLWYNTNNQNLGFVMTILTNGAACLIQSNGSTVATAGSAINGSYTITSPGSGNNPGVKIGSVIDETSVYHIGQGVFQSLRATNFSDSYGNYPASTNVATLNKAANLSPISLHVLVATNGWGYGSFWTNETVPGQALQDALNSIVSNPQRWTNSGDNTPFIFSTNFLGGTVEIGPGIFYLPGGFYISNNIATASWHIYGQGEPNTILMGDSNVLYNANNVLNEGNTAGPNMREDVDHIEFCFSNAVAGSAKTFAVCMNCVGYLNFHDNFIVPFVVMNTTNLWLQYLGGDSIGTLPQATNYVTGMIGLVTSGNTGVQEIDNNVIGSCAVGAIASAEHQRWKDNEFKYCGVSGQGFQQTLYATNDATQVGVNSSSVGGSYQNIYNFDLALGPAIIFTGAGDTVSEGDKFIGCGIGVDVVAAYSPYGPVLLRNDDFEAIKTGYPYQADVMVSQDAAGLWSFQYPAHVVVEDCTDQSSAPSTNDFGMVNAYSFNNSTFVISTNFTFLSGKGMPHIETGGWINGKSGNSTSFTNDMAYQIRDNNVLLMSFDEHLRLLYFNPTYLITGNGAQLTNLISLTQVRGSFGLVNATAKTIAAQCWLSVRIQGTNNFQMWLTNITSGDCRIAGGVTLGLNTNDVELSMPCVAGDSVEVTNMDTISGISGGAIIVNSRTNTIE